MNRTKTLVSDLMSVARRNSCLTAAVSAAIMVLTAIIPVGGCRSRTIEERGGVANRPPAVAPTTEKASKMEDSGDFIVAEIEAVDGRFEGVARMVRDDKFFEKLADDLNRALGLPADVAFRLRGCGAANAEFDPADNSITVCFELFEHYRGIFESAKVRGDSVTGKMLGAVRFAVLHEVGHALIELYDIPVTGSEEDAADRFAIYFAISELRSIGVESVRAAGDGFRIEARNENRRDLNSTEHLANRQRAATSFCLLYGSAARKYDDLVRDGLLARERSEGCETEFQRSSESWEKLLRPWRKD